MTDYRKKVNLDEDVRTPTAMPRMSRASIKALRVSLPDIGVVCIATMPLSVSYRVFEHLMTLCDDGSLAAKQVRTRLMNDESLHLGDKEWSWFWIVLELLRVGVVEVEGGMLVKREREEEAA
jgi:hypothetical protein